MADRTIAGLANAAPSGAGFFANRVGPLGGSGGGSPPPTPAQGIYYIVAQSDQIQSSNNTLVNDNELKLANIPAGQYSFSLFLDFVEANSTMNARFGFTGAATITGGGHSEPNGNVPGAIANGSMVGPIDLTLPAIPLRGGAIIDGEFTMSAQGTLTLQWAQVTSNAGNLTRKAGSWLQLVIT